MTERLFFRHPRSSLYACMIYVNGYFGYLSTAVTSMKSATKEPVFSNIVFLWILNFVLF